MRVGPELEAKLVSLAIGAYPEEAVALLGGQSGRITSLFAVDNVAPDPSRSYLVAPAAQLHVETELRARGQELVAIFHSHPRGPGIPSEVDTVVARPRPEVVHIIVAVDHEELRAWRLEHPSAIGLAGDRHYWRELEEIRCSCDVGPPDYFGNRDPFEDPTCPLHGPAGTARPDPFAGSASAPDP